MEKFNNSLNRIYWLTLLSLLKY